MGLAPSQSIMGLLDEAGYEVVEEYGDYRGKPYRDGDGLIVLVTLPRKM